MNEKTEQVLNSVLGVIKIIEVVLARVENAVLEEQIENLKEKIK